ncbi:hypothetical protein M91_15640 [Bos mutus]|uniref:Src kinase-associated phosphoprotein 1 n=1 Tax=Bos mutus TaxID=72004 RepID=L8IWG6_9CETA|nr:hypothetical protein M91_15640 [Bos mutus]
MGAAGRAPPPWGAGAGAPAPLTDTEDFLAEGLRNENLSAGAKDNRDHILRGLQQIKARYFWNFQPQGGDQPENYLGQDSSDDNHSGTHGPSFTSDAPFLSDYQDEDLSADECQ